MSLDLDQRQRAMLQEMHVRVWWPMSTGAAALETPVAAATVPAQAEPVRPVAAAGPIDAMDWPQLAQAVATCGACKLSAGRKAPVFYPQAHPRQADWLLIGEPPNDEEERAGAPFVGQAGQLLDNMLRALRLSRDGSGSQGAWLTNVVKCRPALVRTPQPDELASCAHYLRREIALVRPRVILAMGRFAAQSLLAADHPQLANVPFAKLRGQVYRYHGVPLVVTYHPATLLRAGQDKANAWADLCLARSVALADRA